MSNRTKIRWLPTVFFCLIHVCAVVGLFCGYTNRTSVIVFAFFFFGSGSVAFQVGLHRYFSHGAFKTTRPIEYFLAWLISINFQGGVARWVANHKVHHQHADTDGDLHSPSRGFFWAHTGWILDGENRVLSQAEVRRLAPNVSIDPIHVWIDRLAIPSTVLLAFVFYWLAGFAGIVWGIFVRLVAIYHVTWFTNSAAHMWGYRNFNTSDQSRNLWWAAVFTFGEWHNNHHRFPSSARAGFRWYEFDLGWRIIQLLQALGLAWDVRLPELSLLRSELEGSNVDETS